MKIDLFKIREIVAEEIERLGERLGKVESLALVYPTKEGDKLFTRLLAKVSFPSLDENLIVDIAEAPREYLPVGTKYPMVSSKTKGDGSEGVVYGTYLPLYVTTESKRSEALSSDGGNK